MKNIPITVPFFDYLLKVSLVTYIISFSIPFFSNIPLILLSLTGVLSIGFISRKNLFPSPVTACLLLFLCSFIISATLSCNHSKTLSLSPSILPGLIIFFLITEFAHRKKYHLIYLSCCASSAFISLTALKTAILSEATSPSVWIQQTELPYFIVPNDLMVLSIFIPYLVIEGLQHRKNSFKALSIAIIVLNITIFTIYRSRGGLLLSLIAICLSLLILKKHIKNIFCILLFGLMIVFIVDFTLDFQLVEKIMAGSDSWLTRLAPWSAAWEIFKKYPFFGSGPRTFGIFYPEMPWVHNLYMETLAEQGLIGIFSLILLMLSVLVTTGKKALNDNASAILFSSSTVLFLGGIIEYSFIRHLFITIFFIVISLTAICSVHLTEQGENYADRNK